ncbi:RPM1 interacting protein 13-like [Henckelia pumila]|uniref:RPM1 interacting protein 13-like n=1 Tax=Henckelia pumila TaxID=405737 RepID=UPI003C6E25ED
MKYSTKRVVKLPVKSRKVRRTSPMVEKEREIIEIDDSYPSPDGKDTPLRPIFCLKNRGQLEEIEKKEECFILDFDRKDELNIFKLGLSENLDDAASPDVRVVAETGQVACRDYPHPRHACAKHPFLITPHDTCCKLCYCYVCDSSAPCEMWTGSSGHCHAFNNEAWNNLRRSKRQTVTTK